MGVSPSPDFQVAVVGGGVVGCAVAYTLARRQGDVVLVEAEAELALGASGTNSGVLHTGFDSKWGEVETEMILRSVKLRDATLAALSVPVLRCGARLVPRGEDERETVAALAEGARRNGVEATLGDDGVLRVPGEWVTDPVAYTESLAAAAASGGASIRLGTRVDALEAVSGGRLRLALADGSAITCATAVNAAGLRADEVAAMAGDESFGIYPRKGEFFVFEAPEGEPLRSIILPVPTARTKGVLVFPTLDGKVVAGPTAIDGDDKDDWSVRPEAWDEVMAKVVRAHPPLEGAEPIASYAGLRPAGRGVNYVIGPSPAKPSLINVAAIRSTGLSASLGIGAFVADRLAERGLELGAERELAAGPPDPEREAWWARASRRAEVRA
jgi:glycerol-3-phosphate dehydrogenase